MIPILVAAVSLAMFVAAMIGPQVDDLRWREVHHAYLGLMLLMVGLALNSTLVQWVGAAFVADDAVQHGVQRFLKRPASRVSLLHLVNAVLYRIPFWRRLNQWADERLS